MKKIDSLINETVKNINGEAVGLADYCDSSSYVCDAISEIVDCDCPVYWSGLVKWFDEEPNSQDYINEAVNEFGFNGDFDIFKAIQWGWCKKTEEEIYQEKNDGLLLAAYVLIRDSYKLEEITDEQTEQVENIDFDRIDTFTDLQNEVESIIHPEND